MKELNTTKKTPAKTSNLKTGKLSAQLGMTAIITSCSEMRVFYFTSQLFISVNLFLQSLAATQSTWLLRPAETDTLQWLPRQNSGTTCYTSQPTELSVPCTAAVCHLMPIRRSFGIHPGQKPCKTG